MNYETVILELMSRVQTLEQKVTFLEEQKANYEAEEQDRENKITRSIARQHVMDTIKRIYGYFDVQKGNRAKQADIILTVNSGDKKGKELLGKFYYSKSFHDFPSGWHTVREADLEKNHIDFYIFTISYENNFYNFLFSHEELKRYVQKKPKDSSDQYCFYFHVKDDKKTENRNGEKNVQFNFENWDLFGEILKTTL